MLGGKKIHDRETEMGHPNKVRNNTYWKRCIKKRPSKKGPSLSKSNEWISLLKMTPKGALNPFTHVNLSYNMHIFQNLKDKTLASLVIYFIHSSQVHNTIFSNQNMLPQSLRTCLNFIIFIHKLQ